MRIFLCCFFLTIIIPATSFSQKGKTVVGIQIKPIFPFKLQGTEKLYNDTGGVHFETGIQSGLNFGLIIRHNFSKLLAFETGINYVKRKYSLKISESNYNDNTTFRIISYEIPFVLMVYAKMGEKTYINGSLGPNLNMYPSHVESNGEFFHHIAFRNQVFQAAISANLGAEYRTDKSGIIYIGASFQRPFTYIYFSKVGYYRDSKEIVIGNELSGTYFTIDLRYFFPDSNRKMSDDD